MDKIKMMSYTTHAWKCPKCGMPHSNGYLGGTPETVKCNACKEEYKVEK